MGTFRTPKETLKYAEENDLECYYPNDKQLFLDLDTEDDLYRAQSFLSILMDNDIVKSYDVLISKSQKWHIIAKLTVPLQEDDRIGLQAICGSDRRKELASWLNSYVGFDNSICLFRKKKSVIESKKEAFTSLETDLDDLINEENNVGGNCSLPIPWKEFKKLSKKEQTAANKKHFGY